jgi:hypothetical protein
LDCGNPRCGFARSTLYILLLCPQCGATMKIIAFIADYALVDRIVNHLKLTFVAERPPPPQFAYQELLMVVKSSAEYYL